MGVGASRELTSENSVEVSVMVNATQMEPSDPFSVNKKSTVLPLRDFSEFQSYFLTKLKDFSLVTDEL